MTPDRGLKSMFTEVVTLEHLTSADPLDGTPTFGAPVQISAYVEAEVPKETNAPGEEQLAYSKVFLWPLTTSGAPYTIGPRDRLTLPAAYTPTNVDVVRVTPRSNHYVAIVLARESALKRTATVQRPVPVQDTKSGHVSTSWADVITAIAEIRPLGGPGRSAGTEILRDNQRRAHRVATFRFQFFTDPATAKIPTPAYRIVSQGRFYEVLDVEELGQREELQFVARERAA